MIVELTCWAPTRAIAKAVLIAANLATVDASDNFIPKDNILINPTLVNDQIAVMQPDGITPVGGFHLNIRFVGTLADDIQAVINGQVDFLTGIKVYFAGKSGVSFNAVAKSITNVPAGFAAPNGFRVYDPSLLLNRRNVWA